MKRLSVSLALVLVVACDGGAPDDLLFVTGELRDTSGALLRGEPMVLERSFPEAGCLMSFELPDTEPISWEGFLSGTTGGDGRFAFELMRFQTRRGTGMATSEACFRFALQSGDGTANELRFQGLYGDSDITPLVRWEAGLAAAVSDTALSFAHAAAPTLPANSEVTHTLVLEDAAGVTVWEAPVGEGPVVVPSAVVESPGALSARVTLDARGELARGFAPMAPSATAFSLTASGPAVSVDVPAVTPVSRGVPCTLGELQLDPCVLTDGSAEAAELMEDAYTDEVELQWAEPVTVSAVVLRGLHFFGSSLTVEAQTAGGAWTQVGTISLPLDEYGQPTSRIVYQVMSLPSPVHASAVRMAISDGFLFSGQELSVIGAR